MARDGRCVETLGQANPWRARPWTSASSLQIADRTQAERHWPGRRYWLARYACFRSANRGAVSVGPIADSVLKPGQPRATRRRQPRSEDRNRSSAQTRWVASCLPQCQCRERTRIAGAELSGVDSCNPRDLVSLPAPWGITPDRTNRTEKRRARTRVDASSLGSHRSAACLLVEMTARHDAGAGGGESLRMRRALAIGRMSEDRGMEQSSSRLQARVFATSRESPATRRDVARICLANHDLVLTESARTGTDLAIPKISGKRRRAGTRTNVRGAACPQTRLRTVKS
jgi:hypothetical protein